MHDAEQAKLSARVYLTEAWSRRHSAVNREFVKTLRRWARNARRRAMVPAGMPEITPKQPAQLELFA